MLDEFHVDCRDGHEHGVSAPRDLLAEGRNVELPEQMHPRAGPQSAAQHVDDRVDVVQRQEQRNAVVRAPFPRLEQCRDLRGNGGVGRDHALGLVGRAGGEDHHRPPRRVDRGQGTQGGGHRVVNRQQGDAEPLAQLDQERVMLGSGHQPGCPRTRQVMLELGNGRGDVERHGDPARPPYAMHHGHVIDASGKEEGHPFFIEVRLAGQQARCATRR